MSEWLHDVVASGFAAQELVVRVHVGGETEVERKYCAIALRDIEYEG